MSSKLIFGNARVSPPVGEGASHGDAGSGTGGVICWVVAGEPGASKFIAGIARVSPPAGGGANGISDVGFGASAGAPKMSFAWRNPGVGPLGVEGGAGASSSHGDACGAEG
ncbi:MAG: hypothetical protein ACXWFS_10460, partial [Thermoanaerobaculia bacterium]